MGEKGRELKPLAKHSPGAPGGKRRLVQRRLGPCPEGSRNESLKVLPCSCGRGEEAQRRRPRTGARSKKIATPKRVRGRGLLALKTRRRTKEKVPFVSIRRRSKKGERGEGGRDGTVLEREYKETLVLVPSTSKGELIKGGGGKEKPGNLSLRGVRMVPDSQVARRGNLE